MKFIKSSAISIKSASLALIFIVITIASFCFLGVTVLLLNNFSKNAREDALRNISEASKSILHEEQRNLFDQTLLLSKLPILQSLVETKDGTTILDGIKPLKAKIKYPIFDIYLGDGSKLISSEENKVRPLLPNEKELLSEAYEQDYVGRLIQMPHSLAFIISAPIGISQLKSGFLVVGFYLDEAFAKDIGKIINAEISFLTPEKTEGGSLELKNSKQIQHGTFDFSLKNTPHSNNVIAFAIHYPSDLFESLKSSLIRFSLITWLSIFFVLSFLGILFSRYFIRSITQLNEKTQKIIESGDLRGSLAVSGYKEIENLSLNFSILLETIRSRENALLESSVNLAQASKMASLGTMGAGVAHELNNPLAIVISFLELIKKKYEDPYLKNACEKMLYASNRMHKIIENLLVFSRKPKEYGFNMSPLSPNDLIKNLAKMFETQLQGKGIRLELILDENLPKTFGELTELESIFQNLIANARDALDERTDSRPKVIQVCTHLKNDKVIEVQVRDTAAGMSPETAAKIFEPFFTTKKSGSGTGLGLALTFSIIERHRGKIRVESELDQGTTFSVELPIYDPSKIEPGYERLEV